MEVDMTGDAGARSLPEVHAEIHAIRTINASEDGLHALA
jgi:hypothetical protein